MKILIVVDPQNDFVHPDGALSIKGALNVIPTINSLLENNYFDYKIITQDWHPENHVSFAKTHGTEPFTMKQTYQGSKFISQVMWPNHCVQATKGADIFTGWNGDNSSCEAIKGHLAHTILRKGNNPLRECYSVFEYVHESDDKPDLTEHGKLFQGDGYGPGVINEVIICGFATDYCVKQTALGAKRLIGNVTVLEDACAAVNPEHGKQALDDLRAVGIQIKKVADYDVKY